MPNYNRFHVNCYLKATCNILLSHHSNYVKQWYLNFKPLVLIISLLSITKSITDTNMYPYWIRAMYPTTLFPFFMICCDDWIKKRANYLSCIERKGEFDIPVLYYTKCCAIYFSILRSPLFDLFLFIIWLDIILGWEMLSRKFWNMKE